MTSLEKNNAVDELDDFDFEVEQDNYNYRDNSQNIEDADILDLDAALEEEEEPPKIINQQVSDVEDNSKEEYVLHVVTDRLTSNLLDYFRSAGLPVSKIYNSLTDVKDALLFQTDAWRLVIIDTGLGKFSSVKGREEFIDVLGLGDEDDNKIAIFFTDSALKSEAKDSLTVDYRDFDWFNYVSTANVTAQLLMLREKYIWSDDSDYLDMDDLEKEYLNTKGLPYLGKKKTNVKHASASIEPSTVAANFEDSTFEELPSFKVKY